MWWYLIMVFTSISITVNGVGHLFLFYMPSVYHLWWNIVQVLHIFFNWLFNYCWVLRVVYIFWVYKSFVIYVTCKYFSQHIAWLFLLLTVCFPEQNFLMLMKFVLFFFFLFVGHAFCVISKNVLPYSRSWRSSVFSFKSFIVLYFTVKLIYHPFWIFLFVLCHEVYVRVHFFVCFLFLFLLMGIQLFHHRLLRKLSFLYCIFTLVKYQLTVILCIFFWTLCCVPLIYVYIPSAIPLILITVAL